MIQIRHIIIKLHIVLLSLCIIPLFLYGCGSSGPAKTEVTITSTAKTIRDNTPRVLTPEFNEDMVFGNEYLQLDTSNSSDGYIYAMYIAEATRIKLQITCDTSITYTYNLQPNRLAVIPLASGDGVYSLVAYEEVQDGAYAMVFATDIDVALTDPLTPFLYPNEYVNFNKDSKVVSKAAEIVSECTHDLDAVAKVYDYVINNITYDHDKAENVQSGYLPDVDNILEIKTGICFDYAAMMASMLRSQRIPTMLEIGYADDSYHAWISVYVEDQGWINDIIQFDGTEWTLMDPTFAANQSNSSLKKLIGNGTNYVVMYNY